MDPKRKPAGETHLPDQPVRTVVIDDQLVFRLGLRIYLEEAMPEVEIVGEADTSEEGILLAEQGKADLVLLDVSLKDQDSAEVLRELREVVPDANLVLLANMPDGNDLTLALNSSADGYLLKTIAPDRLVAGLREVVRGISWVQPELAQQFHEDAFGPSYEGGSLPQKVQALTPRQLDVLRLIAQGLRNAEIANRLRISEQTVKTHIANLLRKLGVTNRVQAARYAIHTRLVAL